MMPDLKPLRNVKTQWDSTYAMIKHLVVLWPVSIPAASCFNHGVWAWYLHWQAIDFFFSMGVNKLSDFKLTDLDWELLQAIGTVLQVSFHSDPYVASSTRYSDSSQSPTRHVGWINAGAIKCRCNFWNLHVWMGGSR
jgi:hypothetical protein